MKRIGISIANHKLSAYVWEKTPFSGRALGSCEVACSEPLGSLDDIRSLAGRLRDMLGGTLPPAVLSIPPGETHIRILELPVPDLKNARIIHRAEIEEVLPFDGEEIASDLLPMEDAEGGLNLFIAFAVRRSTLTRFTELFSEAGFRIESIITDPVSLLCAASAMQPERSLTLVSFENDVILLSVGDLKFRKIRQFPSSILDSPERFRDETHSFFESPGHLLTVGSLPPNMLSIPADSGSRLVPPGDFAAPSVVAFGASVAPFSDRVTYGFSLGNLDQAEDETGRRGARLRFAAIASGIALISCIFALEIARWTATRQVEAVRKQLRVEFSAAVPEAKVVVREAAQIREKINALRRQRAELGLDLLKNTPLLGKISAGLPSNKSLAVKEISGDGNRIRVAGESGGAASVESYRAALGSSFGKAFDVTVQESRGSARADSVTFTILIEKRKAERAS